MYTCIQRCAGAKARKKHKRQERERRGFVWCAPPIERALIQSIGVGGLIFSCRALFLTFLGAEEAILFCLNVHPVGCTTLPIYCFVNAAPNGAEPVLRMLPEFCFAVWKSCTRGWRGRVNAASWVFFFWQRDLVIGEAWVIQNDNYLSITYLMDVHRFIINDCTIIWVRTFLRFIRRGLKRHRQSCQLNYYLWFT